MKKEIIKEVSEYISALPIGAEISIKEVFNELYLSQGYSWVYLNTKTGWVCTRDEGATYIIMDSDLFEVLAGVEKNLSNKGIYMDFSKWDDMCVGLPYNLCFVVRNSNN